MTLGRNAQATFSFEEDSYISGIHFEIENMGDRIEIRDLKSTNRTFLNNQSVTETLLKHGDIIRFGKTRIHVNWTQENDLNQRLLSHSEQSRHDQANLKDRRKASQAVPSTTTPKRPAVEQTPQKRSGLFSMDITERLQLPDPSRNSDPKQSDPVAKLDFPLNSGEYWEWIEKLSQDYSIGIIAHFRKISEPLPAIPSAIPFFSYLPFSDALPIVAESGPWLESISRNMTRLLADGHAIMVLLFEKGCSPCSEVQKLEPPTGFFDWCWADNVLQWISRSEEAATPYQHLFERGLLAIVFPDRHSSELSAMIGLSSELLRFTSSS